MIYEASREFPASKLSSSRSCARHFIMCVSSHHMCTILSCLHHFTMSAPLYHVCAMPSCVRHAIPSCVRHSIMCAPSRRVRTIISCARHFIMCASSHHVCAIPSCVSLQWHTYLLLSSIARLSRSVYCTCAGMQHSSKRRMHVHVRL